MRSRTKGTPPDIVNHRVESPSIPSFIKATATFTSRPVVPPHPFHPPSTPKNDTSKTHRALKKAHGCIVPIHPSPLLTFGQGAGCPSPPKSPHFQRTTCQEGRSGRAGFLSSRANAYPSGVFHPLRWRFFFSFFFIFIRRGEQGANGFRAKWWRGISRCGRRLWDVSGVWGSDARAARAAGDFFFLIFDFWGGLGGGEGLVSSLGFGR